MVWLSCGSCLALSSFGSWRCSLPRCRHGLQSLLKSPAGLVAPVSDAERALPVSLSRPRSTSRFPYRRLLPTGPAAPSCSDSAVPLAWQSGVVLPRPSALVPPVAALVSALMNVRASLARLAPPPCPRSAPRLLTSVRLPPGWLVGVLLAPLGLGGAVATSDGGAYAGTRNGPCGARLSSKLLPRFLGLL